MQITHNYLVEQIQTATRDVLSMMMGIQAECQAGYQSSADSATGTVCSSKAGADSTKESVEAFVGISGPMVGTGTVSCDADTACRLASAMLMTEITGVSTEVLDAMGEVANMIIGNLKTAIEERVGQLWLSVPSVVYGRNFTAHTVGKFEWTVVPIQLPAGSLMVRMCLTEAKKAPPGKHTSETSAAF